MGLLYLLFQFLAALLVVRLAYVHLDVWRRRKRFEKEGVVVLYQWFHFANYIINILPRGGLWTWLFPYRYPQLADDMPGHFKKYNTNFIVFVSWNFQEVFTKYVSSHFIISLHYLLTISAKVIRRLLKKLQLLDGKSFPSPIMPTRHYDCSVRTLLQP